MKAQLRKLLPWWGKEGFLSVSPSLGKFTLPPVSFLSIFLLNRAQLDWQLQNKPTKLVLSQIISAGFLDTLLYTTRLFSEELTLRQWKFGLFQSHPFTEWAEGSQRSVDFFKLPRKAFSSQILPQPGFFFPSLTFSPGLGVGAAAHSHPSDFFSSKWTKGRSVCSCQSPSLKSADLL